MLKYRISRHNLNLSDDDDDVEIVDYDDSISEDWCYIVD